MLGAPSDPEIYAVVAVSCADCGAKMSIKLFEHEPTYEEIKEVKLKIGTMFCITAYTGIADETCREIESE